MNVVASQIADVERLKAAARILREARRTQPMTWIYAIQAGYTGPIKIGITNAPYKRIATLQCGNPERLRGIAAWRVFMFEEAQIHKQFDAARLHGEWFRPVPELVEMVLRMGGDFCDWEAPDWEALES